jgi:hypothetical protein
MQSAGIVQSEVFLFLPSSSPALLLAWLGVPNLGGEPPPPAISPLCYTAAQVPSFAWVHQCVPSMPLAGPGPLPTSIAPWAPSRIPYLWAVMDSV